MNCRLLFMRLGNMRLDSIIFRHAVLFIVEKIFLHIKFKILVIFQKKGVIILKNAQITTKR